MSTRTIAIHHVSAALGGARLRGADTSRLLTDAGITPALLADPRARVTAEQFARLIQVLWDVLDDEFMGFGPHPSKRGSFAMMGLLVVHCVDLGAALRRALSFYELVHDRAPLRVLPDGDLVHFELDIAGFADPDHFLAESLLTLWHRFSSWLIGRRIPLRRADFGYPEPAHVAEYHLMFGCPLRFDQPATALSFEARFLAAQVLQDEASLRRFLRHSPADLLSRRDHGDDLSSRVRRMLVEGIGLQPLTSEAVAGRLGMSEPTLRRRLRDEGTSFRAVRDQLLRDEAVASLVRGRESVEELALRLGFSEASAFHRAFKRWTGANPGAYRAGGPHAR